MSIPEIPLYNILRKRPGDQKTAGLMKFVKSEVKSELNAKREVYMTVRWIVGVGILQFILSILSKKFL
jgi:hypothetical protein